MEHVAPVPRRRYRLAHSLVGRNVLFLLPTARVLLCCACQATGSLLNLLEFVGVELVALPGLIHHAFPFLEKGSRIYRAISYLDHSFLPAALRRLW